MAALPKDLAERGNVHWIGTCAWKSDGYILRSQSRPRRPSQASGNLDLLRVLIARRRPDVTKARLNDGGGAKAVGPPRRTPAPERRASTR